MSYINLAKRFLNEHGEVHFAALGVAISPMVTAAEILKNRRLATVSRITTSLDSLPDDERCVCRHFIIYRMLQTPLNMLLVPILLLHQC